jgi:hypothetical protein
MATTKYNVLANGEIVTTKVKKTEAIEFATAHRNEHRVAVEVITTKGTPVFHLEAPKKIKMSPRYSRVVELPKGVHPPKGKRVGYYRPRVGLAVLHDPKAETEPYSLFDVTVGVELPERFATTRDAGQMMVAKANDAKAAKAKAEANA